MTDADEAVERLTAQLNHLVSLESVGVMVKTTDLAAVLARAARVAELEAALAKANEPEWFFSAHDRLPRHLLEDAVDEYSWDLDSGRHLLQIETARPCKTIWGVVYVFTETELEDQYRDGGPFEGPLYRATVCATEAEARALLKEPDQ